MENKKILVVSDFSFRGSGYLNIVIPLCKGLANKGHEIKAVGFGYMGEEHNFPFSILPCASFGDANALINNLKYLWNTDLVIVAMDIPHQGKFIQLVKSLGMKYIAITPLENPPLTLSWANILAPADKVFFISELGASEARISGLEDAEHLVVGMDTESWRERTPDEYIQGRAFMNISPDTLVVMSVADNQERKNLSKAFEIVGKLKKEKGLKVKYLLVTAEHSPVGWSLRDLAMTYGIASELMLFERGIPFKELYSLYAISDVYLLTSKAEGLGMPVMEAMSVGVPVVATSCGAMPELLRDELGNDRGLLMETEYDMIDPWGNSRRDFPDADSGVSLIERINQEKDGTGNPSLMTRSARRYMESRTWDSPVEQVNVAVEKLYE